MSKPFNDGFVDLMRACRSGELVPEDPRWVEFCQVAGGIFRTYLGRSEPGLPSDTRELVISDAFLKLFDGEGLRRMHGDSADKIANYLRMTVRGALVDHHRKRHRIEAMENSLAERIQGLATGSGIVDREKRELARALEASFDHLIRQGRAEDVFLIRLRFINELTAEEIQRVVKTGNAASIRKRISRTLILLRRLMAKFADDHR